MRRLSRTFLMVGAILSIVFGVLIFISGIGFMLASQASLGDEILAYFDFFFNTICKGDFGLFKALAVVYAVLFIFAGICSVICSVFAFISRNKPTKGMFITVLVLSVLGGSTFCTLGAIFGLIANGQEKRAQLALPKEEKKEEPPLKEEKD